MSVPAPAPAWRAIAADSAVPVDARATVGFSANVTSCKFPVPAALAMSSTYAFAAASCFSDTESDTSTSTTVETLLCVVIQLGRARAIAIVAITRERSTDCTICCASERSVSESTRSKKKAGTIDTSRSHCGASRSTGLSRPGSPTRWMLVRLSIHAVTPR